MAVTLKEVEAAPAAYPSEPVGLSQATTGQDSDAIWARIEAYCRFRWTPRDVVWTVEGEGPWEAPLEPAVMNTVEVWENGAWVECTPAASPWGGYDLPGDGPYRITAEVGAGAEVPAVVDEAYRRLAEYLTDDSDRSGVSKYSVIMSQSLEETYQRNPAWVARAMQYSGAADLLRPYKRSVR